MDGNAHQIDRIRGEASARAVLAGRAGTAAIRRKATYHGLDPGQRKGRRHRRDVPADQEALPWTTHRPGRGPAGVTGVIEGACRHLIKDRLDITGARWDLAGAEAILKLRALISNGDLDQYWTWHLTQEQQHTHNNRYLGGVIPTR